MKYKKIQQKFQTLNGVRPIANGVKANARCKVVRSESGMMTIKRNGMRVELMAF